MLEKVLEKYWQSTSSYIECNVNIKYATFLSFRIEGEIFPQPLFLKVLKYFLLKHMILYVFLNIINK